MKRGIAMLLCFVSLLSVLAGCGKKNPAEEAAKELEQAWTLRSQDAQAVVGLRDGTPVLAYFGTLANGKNRVAEQALALPEARLVQGEKVPFAWRFVSGQQENGALTLKLRDEAGFSYELICRLDPDQRGPLQLEGTFTNETDEQIVYASDAILTAGLSFDQTATGWMFRKESGVAEGVTLYNGTNIPGTGIRKKELTAGKALNITCTPRNDWNLSGYIPMIYLDAQGAYGAYAAVEWPENGIKAAPDEAGILRVTANIAENTGFQTRVNPAQTLRIPTVYLGIYDGDVEDGSNLFKRWFYAKKIPAILRDDPDEPLTQMDMQRGVDVDGWGIQSIKWDYGWWSDEIARPQDDPTLTWTWKTLEGSWVVRASSYLNVLNSYNCKTLREFTDLARSKGLKVATYVLLHDSEAEVDFGLTSGSHGSPEWFGSRRITTGLSADLGNEECVEFLKKELYTFFSESGVTTWRTDFEPISIESDKDNRHYANGKDVMYWCATGFYEIVDSLSERLPGFRYENCCSGGAIKDFATLTRCVNINNDDSADYTSLRTTFYDSSYCIPQIQLQSPVNIDTFAKGSPYYTGTGDSDFGMRSVIMGAVMLGSWSGNVDEALYREYMALYNEKIKPLVRGADLYHILPRPDGTNWDGIQYADKDSEQEIKGCVFLFKPTAAEGDEKTIVLRGLYADRTYVLTSQDERMEPIEAKGKDLMSKGVTAVIAGDMGSDILWITEKK